MLYLIMLSVFVWAANHYQKRLLILLPVVAFFLLLLPKSHNDITVSMLDVGQGEAIVLHNDTKTTYLIDGGSSDIKKVGKYRIQPFLLSEGIDCVDFAIVTHTDEDHISGLKELIKEQKIIIKALILPKILKKEEAYLELEKLAMEYGLKLQYIQEGDQIIDGRLQIRCLHPQPDFIDASPNAYSTTLAVSYGEFDMLFTGDLEKAGETAVINRLKQELALQNNGAGGLFNPDFDVLKVAHHGSKNSTTPDMLSIVKPELSIISCGKNNSYGHPHSELLNRLKELKSKTLITAEKGAILLHTDGGSIRVKQFLE